MKRLLIFALFALPCMAQEPSYSIIVSPDLQYMSSGGDTNKLQDTVSWVNSNKATYAPNLLAWLSTGDAVDTSNSTQWATYVNYFLDPILADNIPTGESIGNHEYEGAVTGGTPVPANRVTTQYTSNVESVLAAKSYFGGAMTGAIQDPEVNNWMQVSNGSSTVGFLFLEFCPRAAALSFAQTVLSAHTGFSDWWIFMHNAVTAAAVLSTTAASGTSGCQSNSVDGVNDSTIGGGDLLWNAVKGYQNVRGIFGGHFSGTPYAAHSTVMGTNGNTVLLAFVNHQYDAPGNETCQTIYQFTPAATTMGVQVNTACPNYGGTGVFGWLPTGNTADGVNNYSLTLQLGGVSAPAPILGGGTIGGGKVE
jgi:hypothetical protein